MKNTDRVKVIVGHASQRGRNNPYQVLFFFFEINEYK